MILVLYPHPALKIKAKPINLDSHSLEDLRILGKELLKKMYFYGGIGLSATQVGIDARIFVYDVSEKRNEPHVVVNPEIVSFSGKTRTREGCVSFPGVSIDRTRHALVHVKFYDPISDQFKEVDCGENSYLSVVMQHEIDHLNGITMIDSVSKIKRDRALAKLRKTK
jgi:peptide deformylase